jgi:glycosyltransferase involved in cell wall biosynthesis
MTDSPRIAFAWKGLPAYGARLIRSAIESTNEPITVIGTRPKVPVESIESIMGGPILWVDDDQEVTWDQLGLRPPALFIATSWATPSFNCLIREVKQAGGKVVCMADNRWKGNLRQWLGTVYFRVRLRKLYDAMWGPGASTRQFGRMLGIPSARLYSNLYSGWVERFPAGPRLDERPLRLVFVGQYIRRKGVDLLVDAFSRFAAEHPDWELQLFGCGELRPQLERMPRASVQPFKQTDEIATAMRAARFLVLPAREDHWPLVVHESASSGCGLILSTAIGNASELASPRNAIIFRAGDSKSLETALNEAAVKDRAWLQQASEESQLLASRYGPQQFAATFRQICSDLLN